MQKVYEELTNQFRKNGGYVSQSKYDYIVKRHTNLFEDSETIFILLQASGYPISEYKDGYKLETYFTPYQEQKFCIIDIETNGSKPDNSQVIEIGAVMVQNGEIIDVFETFVECAFIPEYISKITGIEQSDLKGAPSRKEALTKLREFMQDAVFVAHNVSFDYSFLSSSFNRFGLGDIGNPRFCTINLAKRTFESPKYGLAYLNESLNIKTATHHRAYSDALSAFFVMKKSLETLPNYVITTDDLIKFSTSSKRERGLKKRRVESKKVLIMCTGNSCRSIIAEALINRYLDGIEAYSCGVAPSGKVNKNAKRVLKENGIWRNSYHSKHLDEVINLNFDLVVTVCSHAKENCPIFPKAIKTTHIGFTDPDGKEYDEFIETYRDIKNILLPKIRKRV